MSESSGAPRVLLSAYQCGPGMGSVSQIGWEWYSRMARRVPTTLVTHVRNRAALEQAGVREDQDDVVYIDTEWLAGPLYRWSSRIFGASEHAVFLVSSSDFFFFDRQAVKRIRGRMRNGERWDIAHAVTPVSPASPTTLFRLGIPLVRGPLNGGLGIPPGFGDIMKEEYGWLYPVRNVGHLLDRLNGSTRNTTVLLSATQSTFESFPERYQHKIVTMIENGVELNRFTPMPWPSDPSSENPVRLLFVGRLIPFKGIPMLIEAVSAVRSEMKIEVRIVGEGAMKAEWKELVRQKGLESEIRLLGGQSLDQVAEHMKWCHAFVLPSVRESGGAVLLEAMASARPVAAVGYGGPAEIVDDDIGVLIPPSGPDSVIRGLIEVIRSVKSNPEIWRGRGQTGLERARTLYSWESKMDQALEIYRNILKQKQEAS